MKRTKMFSLVAFVVGIGLAILSHAATSSTTWVYQSDNQRTDAPSCEFSSATCAIEYNVNPDGSLGAPTGNEMQGNKLD